MTELRFHRCDPPHPTQGLSKEACPYVKGERGAYRLRWEEAPEQERRDALQEWTMMADYGHTKGWGGRPAPTSQLTPIACSKVTRAPWPRPNSASPPSVRELSS